MGRIARESHAGEGGVLGEALLSMQSDYAMARARIELATVLFDASVDRPAPGG